MAHPVLGRADYLATCVEEAWQAVWSTQVGTSQLTIPFRELEPRAQIVGDFLESVLALRLRLSLDNQWRRGSSKEKDLIYLGNDCDAGEFDFEIKTSGQSTGKIYGNRSYAQPGRDGSIDSPTRKKRSGYYLCVNFWGERIYNIRVGWIDPGDWEPQQSPTGQMAGLKDYVYRYKLLPVPGSYYLLAPLLGIPRLGEKSRQLLSQVGISSLGDLVRLIGNVGTAVTPKQLTSALESVGVPPPYARRIATTIAPADYFQRALRLAPTR